MKFLKKKPFLGICVGMQLMATTSEEFGEFEGLGWIEGKVKKMKSKILPHIGWNDITIKKDSKIFSGLDEHKDFYFVHSYCVQCPDESLVMASADYGLHFHAALGKDNVFAVQFHPEKSGDNGLKLLQNFLSWQP